MARHAPARRLRWPQRRRHRAARLPFRRDQAPGDDSHRADSCGLCRHRLDSAQGRSVVARAAIGTMLHPSQGGGDRSHESSSLLPPIAKRGQERRPKRPLRSRSNSRVHLVRVARSSPRPNAMQMRKPRCAGFGGLSRRATCGVLSLRPSLELPVQCGSRGFRLLATARNVHLQRLRDFQRDRRS
jgi:hypothetical protein